MTMMTDNLLLTERAIRCTASPKCRARSAAVPARMAHGRASLWLLGCLVMAWTSGVRAAGTQTDASPLPTNGTVPLSGSAGAKGDAIRHLWSSRVSSPDPNEDAKNRLALMQLVRRVQSVKFESNQPAPAFAAPAEPPQTTAASQPGAAPAESTKPAESPGSRPVTVENPASLSAKAAKTLENWLSDPGRVRDPLEMAELLFLSGRQTEAAPFYEKALELTIADDANTSADRAWILFQLANCLRETDQVRAKDTYMMLVAEYPASPWAEIAKAHGQFITWYQKTKPRQLIAQRQP